ncbi:MAG: T9SS type A sorting domain-containing protein [Ignavibacteria bacterium]|nr:T9SS type A sorting domain-containing protein [Ignavibacteria bacterium]
MGAKNLFLLILSSLILFFIYLKNPNDCFGWYSLYSGTSRNLNDVIFININTGWVGGDSILIKTTNGGINWIIQQLPVQITVRSIYFTNENEGFILGDWMSSTPSESKIYFLKTTNSGNSWSIINLHQVQSIGTIAYSKNFIIVTDNVILKTYSEFTGSSSSGRILKSTNGGVNFYTVLNFGDMSGVSFVDLNTGWAMGTASSSSPLFSVFKVFKTTNQGENWFNVYTDSQPSSGGLQGKAIKFFNQSTGYILATLGNTRFMKTSNGGINWTTNQYNHYNNRTMFFSDLNTGWIGGSSSTGSSNIRKTIDAGVMWIEQNQSGTGIINKLFFINNNIGWAVGNSGLILKTTNGGTSTIKSLSNSLPSEYLLKQNYPNPFNNLTKFEFHIPESADIKLIIYDLLGREIMSIVDESLQAGIYIVDFDASNLASGVYLYRLLSDKFSDVKLMVLIK